MFLNDIPFICSTVVLVKHGDLLYLADSNDPLDLKFAERKKTSLQLETHLGDLNVIKSYKYFVSSKICVSTPSL